MNVSVKLIDPDIAGGLVKSVHILGHNPPQFVRPFQLKKLPVGRVGFCLRIQHMFPVPVKEFLRLKIEK